MQEKYKCITFICILVAFLLLLLSCSSSPRRTTETATMQQMSRTQPKHYTNSTQTGRCLLKTENVCFYSLVKGGRGSPEKRSPWLPLRLRLRLPLPPLSLRVLTWTALSCHPESSARLFTEQLGRAPDGSTSCSTSLAFHNKVF